MRTTPHCLPDDEGEVRRPFGVPEALPEEEITADEMRRTP